MKDRHTEITADAVKPVRTVRFAVMNLCQSVSEYRGARSEGIHFRLLVVFSGRVLQYLGHVHHDCAVSIKSVSIKIEGSIPTATTKPNTTTTT